MRSSRSERDRQALADILENALLAQSFVAGMNLKDFVADRRTFYAVTRCLEIISEASRRLDQATRDRNPYLPWRAIIGAGNIYRHDYGDVVETLIWQTAERDLDDIIRFAKDELDIGVGGTL